MGNHGGSGGMPGQVANHIEPAWAVVAPPMSRRKLKWFPKFESAIRPQRGVVRRAETIGDGSFGGVIAIPN